MISTIVLRSNIIDKEHGLDRLAIEQRIRDFLVAN